MERELDLLRPLVNELQEFCSAVKQGDAHAADRMIASVEGIWPEIPPIELEAAEEDPFTDPEAEARSDLLAIVADVGGVAETLLSQNRPMPTLAWCRANLICDLKRFKASSSRPAL